MRTTDRTTETQNRRKAALMAFAQAFNRESHHLMDHPDQTWPLLFNRLQWENGLVQERLAPQLAQRKRPWIRTWSPHAESGTLIRTIPAHAGAALACAVSPDGYTFASGGKDGTLKLWNAANGKHRFTLRGHDGWVSACAFSPDSRLLLSGSWDKTLKIWDASTGQEIATLTGHTGRINDCTFSVFGSHILSAGEDGALIFWDFPLKRDPLVLRDHGQAVRACAFSPDSRFFLSAGEDGAMRIWGGEETLVLEDPDGKVKDCAISPDGRFIVSIGGALTLRTWRKKGRWQSTILNPEPRFLVDDRCAIGPDGRMIATYSSHLGSSIRLWDEWDEKEIGKLDGHGGSVGGCAFTPDGKQLLSASSDGSLKVWDVRAMQREAKAESSKSLKFARSRLLGWSERHKQIAATVETWAAPREKEGSLKLGSFGNKLTGALSPDERFLITVEENKTSARKTFKLWDMEQGKQQVVHGKPPYAFSPDGRVIIANDRRHMHAWDPATGDTLWRSDREHPLRDCSVSPDGRRVLTSDGGRLRLWDLQTGEPDPSTPVMEGGARCAFSSDGRFILTNRAGILIALDAITGATLAWGYLPWSIGLDHAHPLHPFFASGPEEDARLVELCGIDYDPPLITPVVLKDGPTLTCPLCREPFPYVEAHAGKTITCPNPACQAPLAVSAEAPLRKAPPDQAELAELAQELQACLSRGDDLRLLEIIDRIEEADPFVPAFKLSRTEALIRLERYKEAIAFLEQVKKLHWLEERDDESLATYLEGVAYAGLGDSYIMGADGAQRQANARYMWAWTDRDEDDRAVEMGFAEMRLRRFQRAEALLRPLAERESPYPRACYGLGLALLTRGNHEGCAWIKLFLEDPGDTDERDIERARAIQDALCGTA